MSRPVTLPLPFKIGLSAEEASSYLGLSRDAFVRDVRNGHLPKPWRGDIHSKNSRCVWDRRALEDHLDGLRNRKAKMPGRKTTPEDWQGILNGEGAGNGR